MATHIQHNIDKDKGWYETAVQRIGFESGHSVILESEYSNVLNKKFTEGTWDGRKFELATRETGTANNILRGLKHCAAKPDTKVAFLYFPKELNIQNLEEALRRYKSEANMPERTHIKFERILCITNDGIIYDQPY